MLGQERLGRSAIGLQLEYPFTYYQRWWNVRHQMGMRAPMERSQEDGNKNKTVASELKGDGEIFFS